MNPVSLAPLLLVKLLLRLRLNSSTSPQLNRLKAAGNRRSSKPLRKPRSRGGNRLHSLNSLHRNPVGNRLKVATLPWVKLLIGLAPN
jgi:hypothetical protein